MTICETPITFPCQGESLIGLISAPQAAFGRGVLIVVGGPQYRVGSHRQFVLLARALAAAGIPAMRFDYRGMGDSEGELRTFAEVESDIHAAVDAFFDRSPGLTEVVLWGLCDAASAILFYARSDPRVCGIVLANPWTRTEQGLAKAHLKHYYIKRLFDRSLWRKIGSGRFQLGTSAKGLAVAFEHIARRGAGRDDDPASQGAGTVSAAPLPERMREGLAGFDGRVLVILSGNDLTAREFEDTVKASPQWRRLLKGTRVTTHRYPQADHTFSRREWRDRVAAWTAAWLRSW